jgi:phenylalanyl-tRNA synthetase alpha chain
MRSGERHFLVTGDVYRRDAIDKTHYPVRHASTSHLKAHTHEAHALSNIGAVQVFHQMEGVRIFTPEQLKAQNKTPEEFVAAEMKDALEGMISAVFGKVQVRYA